MSAPDPFPSGSLADLRPWLDRVRLAALPEARRRGEAGRAAKATGFGLDLQGHRPYQPGDELRHLDWHAWARLGELVVREYRAEAAPTVAVVIDTSASMGLGGDGASGRPTKLEAAIRLAGALAYLALREQGRIALAVFAERGRWLTAPIRGLASLCVVSSQLARLDPAGGTNLAGAWTELASGLTRVDLTLVLSDFLVENLAEASQAGPCRRSGAVVLLQLLDRDELWPPEEEAELRDPEATAEAPLRAGAEVVPYYRRALARHSATLASLASRRGWRRATLLADDPPGRWLAAGLAAGILSLRAS